tara:strand:- start:316 stop:654 length:339 start_codon:yes stop_codon:yes gene_type:complete
MIWPPVKAWTSTTPIDGCRHFVAINYGGDLADRWVLFVSVLDSGVLVKVLWSQLVDSSKWECGWDENSYSNTSFGVDDKSKIRTNAFIYPSIDSGLTIPITKYFIRPWFENV